MRPRGEAVVVGGHTIPPGERLRFDLPVALLPTHTELSLPFTVLNGRKPGPWVWVSAALHGDELNGVEIIRRVLHELPDPLRRGVLIAVPIVNVFGFIQQSRYLPDRRDLNRSFPGSARGSLAGRIAHLFMTEVVQRCQYGLDLHTGSNEKSNYPQIRADLADPETDALADAFGAPVKLDSALRSGSLRAKASKLGIKMLLYEGGESQRFNEHAIDVGARGVMGVLHHLDMTRRGRRSKTLTRRLSSSTWIRARKGGLLRLFVQEGQLVNAKQTMGIIADPLGDEEAVLRAPFSGLVIGHTNNPVVHGGDAVLHLGQLDGAKPPTEPGGSPGAP